MSENDVPVRAPDAVAPPRDPSLVEFVLPHGHRDRDGVVHREGVVRAARVADELAVLGDFRVYLRPVSFLKVALARTIVRLGALSCVDVGLIERLDDDDLDFLARLYREINGYDSGSGNGDTPVDRTLARASARGAACDAGGGR